MDSFPCHSAVITGASAGIGAAAARELAQKGAGVVLMARNRQKLEKLVAEIVENGGRAVSFAGGRLQP